MTCGGAALVLAHGYPEGVGALAQYFEAAGFDLFVHVDRKVALDPFHARLAGRSGVILVEPRVNVFWRGFSVVEATIGLITAALQQRDYPRYVLISDDSLPLVGPRVLSAMLEQGQEFLEASATTRPDFLRRYDRFYMLDSVATQIRWLPVAEREVTPDAVLRINRLESLRKRGKRPLEALYHGSQWWALQRISVEAILNSWHTDHWLRESFEFSEVPDEHYFQTILGMERNSVWNTLVHTEWDVPVPPRVYTTIEEIGERAGVGAPFIRKVRLTEQQLHDYMPPLLA